MKAIVKKYFQELVECIEFPTLVYIYETGKIIGSNNLAKDIIGKTSENFNKLWMENHRIRIEKDVLDGGSYILYNKKQWNHRHGLIEVDIEFNSISLDDQHIIICFFEYSYKQCFVRNYRMQLPRFMYRDKKNTIFFVNQMLDEDMGNQAKTIGRHVFDEDTKRKLEEDSNIVFTTKEPLLNVVQFMRKENTLGYMTTIHRIPLINKNGTLVGMVAMYMLLFSREEYKRFYDVTLRQNNILGQIISRSETIILNWRKELNYQVEYVSSNISQWGISVQELYDGSIRLHHVVVGTHYDQLIKKIHMLESGEADYFELEIPLENIGKEVIWVKAHIAVSRNLDYSFYFECLLQDITEKRRLQEQLRTSKESLRAYKKYENLYNIQPIKTTGVSEYSNKEWDFEEKGKILERAIKQRFKGFEIYFQPIKGANGTKVVAVEALLRWNSPELGSVTPGDFMSLSQYMGLMLPLGDFAIARALREYRKICKRGKNTPLLHLNLSLVQIIQKDIVSELIEQVNTYHVHPAQIVIEVKESLAVEDIDLMRSLLLKFHHYGFKVALDNFGAGFISVNHIIGMTFDYVKLDKEIIKQYHTKQFNPGLIHALIDMIRSIDTQIIIEGIETKEQLDFIETHDIYACQGYFVGEPMKVEELCTKYEVN